MLRRFTKMHGLGNDFMVFEARADERLPDAATWRALADRHTGIGFDQALVILPPQNPQSTASYRIFNADGGEVEQCGNGARCVAEWLRQSGRIVVRNDQSPVILESKGGHVEARFDASGLVSVNMGVPSFAADRATTLHLDRAPAAFNPTTFTEVSMGNPHIVIRVDDADTAPVATLGRELESHPRFPNRTNVGFLQVLDRRHARLRVFERGVGETLACGTGACAAMAVGHRAGWLDEQVEIRLPRGSLTLNWRGDGSPMWMTGPAAVAFHGEVEIP